MKPFYQTRLSDGRKIELSQEEYWEHAHKAAAALSPNWKALAVSTKSKTDKLVRTHLELGGHLKG